MPYCVGCRLRNKNCAFLKKHCSKLSSGEVTFCFECNSLSFRRLKTLGERYKQRYRMSMIENLNFIKAIGIERFLADQEMTWKCQNCGASICCHKGIFFNCGGENLRCRKEKYHWQ